MEAVLPILEKGLALLPLLVQAGVDIAGVVSKMLAVVKAQQDGTLTDQMTTDLENELDAQIIEFNKPMT